MIKLYLMAFFKTLFTEPKLLFKKKKIMSGYQSPIYETKKNSTLEFIFYIALACLFIIGLTKMAGAQTIPVTIQKDVVICQANGVLGLETIKADFYVPSGIPKGILVWEHGGGFIAGDKGSGNAVLCKFWASGGWLVINTNYRLGSGSAITKADSINATRLMWEAAYRAIEDAKAGVRYAYIHSEYNVNSSMPVYIGGISAGGVAGDLAASWQPSEFAYMVDTTKWKNYSNGLQSVNITGGISISGAVFLPTDIDHTDKVMIRCYGLLDNTLKCNGGFNHKCKYTGECQITTLQNDLGNTDFALSFPNAAHGLKEGFLNIQGALNIKKARQYILNSINSLL
jgi:hypothetical protein